MVEKNKSKELVVYFREKWHDAGIQRYLKNMGWLFIARSVSLLVSFFMGIYIARYLQPANYGMLSYVLGFVGLFSFIASLGVDALISRDLVAEKEKTGTLLGTGLVLKLAGGIIAFGCCLIVSLFINKEPLIRTLVLLYSLSLIIQGFSLFDLFFQANVLSKKSVQVQIASNIFVALLKIAAIAFHRGLFLLVSLYLLESILNNIGIYLNYRKVGSYFNLRFDYATARNLLWNAWPLFFAGATVIIYLDIDQILIKQLLTLQQVGIYSIAVKLSEAWYFIGGIICGNFFPAIINAKKVSEELYENRFKKIYFLLIWIAIAIALPISIFAKPIIHILFGPAYTAASTTLSIYIWSNVSFFIGFAVNQYLTIENKTKTIFLTTLFGMIANILLNILLIPRIGIIGSAIATLISYTIATFSIVFFKTTRPHIKLIIKGALRM